MDFISASEESRMHLHLDSLFLLFFGRQISKQCKIKKWVFILTIRIVKQRAKVILGIIVVVVFVVITALLIFCLIFFNLLLLLLLFFFLFLFFFCLKMYFWSIFNNNILVSLEEFIHVEHLREGDLIAYFLSLKRRIIQRKPVELEHQHWREGFESNSFGSINLHYKITLDWLLESAFIAALSLIISHIASRCCEWYD